MSSFNGSTFLHLWCLRLPREDPRPIITETIVGAKADAQLGDLRTRNYI